MERRTKGAWMKKLALCLMVALMTSLMTGCSLKQKEEEPRMDFSAVYSVCELATLRCYYHNVAREEQEASGLFKIFGVGYKKIWMEYDGIVEYGIDISQVKVSEPDENNQVVVTMPKASVQKVIPDQESMMTPLTDTGFMTSITTEEKTAVFAKAQEHMQAVAETDTAMLRQAENRARLVIEEFIDHVGEINGEEYTIQWVEAETNQ